MKNTAIILTMMAGPVAAQDLQVVTDIAPVRALIAEILADDGQVEALLPPGASPHDYAMRPSDAAGLASADIVIWVGEGLTPWLARPIESLAKEASVVALLDAPGWAPRVYAEDAHDDHDDAEHGDDAHDHNDHKDAHDHEDHDEAHDHDDHGAEEHSGDEHAHDHGPIDPHGWMDPDIAAAWSLAIGEALASVSPDNADVFRARADVQANELRALTAAIAPQLTDVGPYLLPHDGYAYFEARFGLDHAGMVSNVDDEAPGPAHLAELRELVTAGEVSCLFYETGPVPGWVETLSDGYDLEVIALDPLGANVADDAGFYPALITGLADRFAQCK